jgi:hypothetical protein
LPFLLVFSTVFVVSKDLANGVVSGNCFYLGVFQTKSIRIIFYLKRFLSLHFLALTFLYNPADFSL